MSGEEEDRLSALGDDILRRILHFTPSKEAASTCVLSRRWGSLWRSSGAVNLAVHALNPVSRHWNDYLGSKEAEEVFFTHRDAFIRAAEAALAASDVPITRLTLHVEADHENVFQRFFHTTKDWRGRLDLVDVVVSHPASCQVEELRISVGDSSDDLHSSDEEEVCYIRWTYTLESLPSETLRVLDLTRCRDLALPDESVRLPRLVKLRLRSCSVVTKDVQALIDAAPQLSTVHLDSVLFKEPEIPQFLKNYMYKLHQQYEDPQGWNQYPVFQHQYQDEQRFLPYQDPELLRHHIEKMEEAPLLRLRCLGATSLMLASCSLETKANHGDNWPIEIEAPRLRSFVYKGRIRPFVLTTPVPDVVHVDLLFYHYNDRNNDQDTRRMLFWQFAHNFRNAKLLKMKVNYLEDIAAVGKARRAELLCSFPNVDRLELEGVHNPTSKKSAVAIANLLRCCPTLRDLRLKLSSVAPYSTKDYRYAQSFTARKDGLDYEKSLNRFMFYRPSKPVISLGDNCGDQYEGISDIPGLRGRSFACLHSSLRRVGLQFRLDKANCFGVQLIKFFSENATVLEEISFDIGNRRLLENINLNVERWITQSSSNAGLKCKNLMESSWEFSRIPEGYSDSATDLKITNSKFRVIPLQR